MKKLIAFCVAVPFAALPISTAVILPLTATDAVAEKKGGPPTRKTMLRRCDQRALWCEQDCDKKQLAGDLTDAQYKKCNDACETKFKACVKRVDEVRPQRTTGGGSDDPEGDGGLLLSPD